MNPAELHIDAQQLQRLLASEHDVVEAADLLEHLETCGACRQQLEKLAADAGSWDDAQRFLSPSGLDDVTSESGERSFNHHPDSLVWRDSPLEWTEGMVRELLAPASHPELLGRIGRYDVERFLGAGGMGIVFKAFDTELHRPVAIKVLAPHLAHSPAARARFAREAKAAAAVVHEHVVPIYNVESERPLPMLVMQFVLGETLQQRIDREGPMGLSAILRIGLQIARGLAAAHAQGLVHRDIKPSNVLLEQDVERALIADFGLARAADDAHVTRTGFHVGTPAYMSPEQARGEPIDARSDLFSLGCVLYTMCAGKPPFVAETSLGVLRRITDSEPPSLVSLRPDLPKWMQALVDRLMAKEASDRFSDASSVSEVLESALAHHQAPKSSPVPSCLRARHRFDFWKIATGRFLMEDKRILSMVALGMFLCAMLIPLPMAAFGRHEYAVLFAAVASVLAVLFALLSRKYYFSRLVLVFVGVFAGLGAVGLAASIFAFSWRARLAQHEVAQASRHASEMAYRTMMLQSSETPPEDFSDQWVTRNMMGLTKLEAIRLGFQWTGIKPESGSVEELNRSEFVKPDGSSIDWSEARDYILVRFPNSAPSYTFYGAPGARSLPRPFGKDLYVFLNASERVTDLLFLPHSKEGAMIPTTVPESEKSADGSAVPH